jgi:hypothetical protein
VLSVRQILAGLDDRFRLLTGGSRTALPRQQTLLSSVDWSYELLDEAERVLLRRLSVFAGTFALEAAEPVCAGGDVDGRDVFGLLGELVDKSLVVVDALSSSARYRLLETVRQYAGDRLIEAGEEWEFQGRHRDFFVDFGARRSDETEDDFFDRIVRDLDNIRRALQRSQERKDAAQLLRLSGRLWGFWVTTTHLVEGLRWLETALAIAGDAPDHLRARALRGAAHLAIVSGDMTSSRTMAEEALALYRRLGNVAGVAWALLTLSDVTAVLDELDASRAYGDELLVVARELGEPMLLGLALNSVAVHHMYSDFRAAREMLAEAKQLADATDNRFAGLQSTVGLGLVA